MINRGGALSETTEPTGNAIDPCFLPGRNSAGEHGRTSPLHVRPPLLPSISFPLDRRYRRALIIAAGKSGDFTGEAS